MCEKSQKNGHQFEPFKLSVDSKAGPRETEIKACKRCGGIQQGHHRDLVTSLQAMGVFFSIVKL